ncbi:MAG TPA: hypothetical protein VN783_01750 [Thermoanaerobaculia bacterium]|nr:hypothetical protein [Thermoanaerobaculia bacterium]
MRHTAAIFAVVLLCSLASGVAGAEQRPATRDHVVQSSHVVVHRHRVVVHRSYSHHRVHRAPVRHEVVVTHRVLFPPGLARVYGPRRPARAYVAFDPRYNDRAWFLIDGRWVLRDRLDPDVRVEIRHLLAGPPLPLPPPPPIPLPDARLRLMLFPG